MRKDRRCHIEKKSSECSYFESCGGNPWVPTWFYHRQMRAEVPVGYVRHEELGMPRYEITIAPAPLELVLLEGRSCK